MKILHISDSDGGNQQAAGAQLMLNRLHRQMIASGIDSTILCARKSTDMDSSMEIKRSFPSKAIDALIGKITIPLGLNELNNVSAFKIPRMQQFAEADLIHLHTMHSGFFAYYALPFISKKKPTVFTLHDMWAYTGHCTASRDCEKWLSGCGACPYPEDYPPISRDNTRLEWRLKSRIYQRSKLTVVTVSPHQDNEVGRSMLGHLPRREIAHGIDTQIFRPSDKKHCRKTLGIPEQGKIILFGATDLGRSGKGGDILVDALNRLPPSAKTDLVLLTFGNGGDMLASMTDVPLVSLGYIDSQSLPMVYSASDIFVFPSLKETFGLVLLESMACGTPVVSFDVGAAPELVLSGQTGWLAKEQNADELCLGITQLLANDSLREQMGKQGRKLVESGFSLEHQARQYVRLYEELLAQ